jgi:hypothetical protein
MGGRARDPRAGAGEENRLLRDNYVGGGGGVRMGVQREGMGNGVRIEPGKLRARGGGSSMGGAAARRQQW